MLINRTSVIAYLCFLAICLMSPISKPVIINAVHPKVMFFIDIGIKITKYEIFESKKHLNDYFLLRSSCDIILRDNVKRNTPIIDINDIENNTYKEYIIYITTGINIMS